MLTFCKSFDPVTTGTFRGWDRMSKMMGRCSHGMMKCVPSPTTCCLIPWKRSKMTARRPASTETQEILTSVISPPELSSKYLPLYNAEFTAPPAKARPRPSWPRRLKIAAIFLQFTCGVYLKFVMKSVISHVHNEFRHAVESGVIEVRLWFRRNFECIPRESIKNLPVWFHGSIPRSFTLWFTYVQRSK